MDVLGRTLGALWGLLRLLWGVFGTSLVYFGSTLGQHRWFLGAPQQFFGSCMSLFAPIAKTMYNKRFFKGFTSGRVHSGGTLRALGDTFGVPEDTVGVLKVHFGHSHGRIGGCFGHYLCLRRPKCDHGVKRLVFGGF